MEDENIISTNVEELDELKAKSASHQTRCSMCGDIDEKSMKKSICMRLLKIPFLNGNRDKPHDLLCQKCYRHEHFRMEKV